MSFRNLRLSILVLTPATLAVAFAVITGCGQNAHLTQKGQAASAPQTASADTAAVGGGSDSGSPVQDGASPPTGDLASGDVTDASHKQEEVIEQASGAAQGASAVQVVIHEKAIPGKNGDPGRDGCGIVQRVYNDLKTWTPGECDSPENSKACAAQTSAKLKARVAGKVLPYKDYSDGKLNLKLGLFAVGGSKPPKTRLMKDSHVYMSFAVRLPPAAAVRDIRTAEITLHGLNKAKRDNFDGTEILCMLGAKVCTGRWFASKDWQHNINEEFFGAGGRPANTKFSDALINPDSKSYRADIDENARVSKSTGGITWERDKMTLSVAAILEGSRKTVDEALYAGLPETGGLQNLEFVVADDTYVGGATFSVDFDEDTCKTYDILHGKK